MTKAWKRTTIRFPEELHTALRLKAAATGRSVSDLVNEAVAVALLEDREDLAEFEKRTGELSLPYDQFLNELKSLDKL